MSKDTQALDLVLEIVRGQQAVLERLLVEVHGSEGPGLKGAVTDLRARVEGIEKSVTDFLTGQKESKKTFGRWVRDIITWAIAIAAVAFAGRSSKDWI